MEGEGSRRTLCVVAGQVLNWMTGVCCFSSHRPPQSLQQKTEKARLRPIPPPPPLTCIRTTIFSCACSLSSRTSRPVSALHCLPENILKKKYKQELLHENMFFSFSFNKSKKAGLGSLSIQVSLLYCTPLPFVEGVKIDSALR